MTTLVVGATGRLGPHLVKAVDAAGRPVSALVRDPVRAAGILPSAARIVVGDFTRPDTLDRALEGIEAIVLLTPHGPSMADVQIDLVARAADAGVRVVKISGTSTGIRPDGPEACRRHWEVERAVIGSGARHVILRPNAFMQGLVAGVIATAARSGVVNDPISKKGISAVDCRDIADVTAAVLANPAYDGRTLTLTGPESVTFAGLAACLRACGTRAEVRTSSPPEAAAAARAHGVTAWEARHLEEMLTLFANGGADFVTADVEETTGHPPRSVRAFIEENVPAR
ncbi:NAD(P)H-binding protein [Streptomyces sp. NPDC006265]|uniref:NAD(P)H-binding protein n=1 Tax=Streptomyces sp. NPDC006265 TaxID=3156740 RepID=UPI0033B9C430